jgi:hypothetical protein
MSHQRIQFYNLRMTHEIAIQQSSRNLRLLRAILRNGTYEEVFIQVGQMYLAALTPMAAWLPISTKLIVPTGGIGRKMQQMKSWLLAEAL